VSTRFSYSTHVRCPDPEGQKCTRLWRSDGTTWNNRHGSAGWAARIPIPGGVKLVKRFGYPSKAAAEAAARHAGELLALAGDDNAARARIGGMIAATRRGQPLPATADVARRLGLGLDPASTGVTFGEAWAAWLAGKRRLRRSSRERIGQIGDHWLLPVLADVPLERLNGAHCAQVFGRIETINAEITARQGEGRAYVRVDGDVRARPRVVSTASQHRVYAALREFCNFEMRVTRRLSFNPVYAVELEPEVTPEAQRWTAEQAAAFLAASSGDPLGLLFRVVLLAGPRRGEAIGLRWSGADLDAGFLRAQRTVLMGSGELYEDAPKTRAGERLIWLDDVTAGLLREHRTAQRRARMQALPGTWQDNDLIFCQPDGTPWRPDHVTRRFQAIAREAGLPVIRLHEGRHSAVSLQAEAGVDPELTQRTVGHAGAAMRLYYTHPQAQAYRAAANATAAHVDGAAR
jgi:integrase